MDLQERIQKLMARTAMISWKSQTWHLAFKKIRDEGLNSHMPTMIHKDCKKWEQFMDEQEEILAKSVPNIYYPYHVLDMGELRYSVVHKETGERVKERVCFVEAKATALHLNKDTLTPLDVVKDILDAQ